MKRFDMTLNVFLVFAALAIMEVLGMWFGYMIAERKYQTEAIQYGYGYIETSVDGTIHFFVWKIPAEEPEPVVPEFPYIKNDVELEVKL